METLPMKIIDIISEIYKEPIISTIDVDYNICIYIRNIDRIKNKKYFSNLEGRGLTYRDACIDYIKKSLDTNYSIRHKRNYYATRVIRNIARRYKDLNEMRNIENV